MSTPQIYNLIFEDWFTTSQGGGQGMGIILSNVKKYNGTIDVQSELGKGTVFTMILPLYEHIINKIKIETSTSAIGNLSQNPAGTCL